MTSVSYNYQNVIINSPVYVMFIMVFGLVSSVRAVPPDLLSYNSLLTYLHVYYKYNSPLVIAEPLLSSANRADVSGAGPALADGTAGAAAGGGGRAPGGGGGGTPAGGAAGAADTADFASPP